MRNPQHWIRQILLVSVILGMLLLPTLAPPALCQDKPRSGGELVMAVPSEPPSYDGHREETFGLIHPIAPFYSLLLRVDLDDPSQIVGDLAERWTISGDKLTYTFGIRKGVKFHDGSSLTAKDVKASYDKIIFPPAGVVSTRQGQYRAVEAVEVLDDYTVRFRLKWPSASMLSGLASPWNFIYKADQLAKDMHWYESHIMGSGPFVFVEHVRGSHLVGKKNPNYWDKGKPFLDGYRAIFISDTAARVAAIRGERVHIEFRGLAPKQRDEIVKALGPKITVQESPWDCILLVAINHEKKPFDDKRVRRALSLALDRYEGSRVLSQIAIVKEVAGVQVPGTPFATPPEELTKLTGYGRDPEASRQEARRLLKEAGAEGFSFTFKNRGIPMPYEPLGIWLIDQWRKVGLNVTQEVIEAAAYYKVLRGGEHEVAMDFQCGYIVDPDLDLYKFLSVDKNPSNYSRYIDRGLDELYELQSRATDPEARKQYIKQFEKRLLDEEAHYLMTLQWHRIVPHSAKVKGWKITPSHYLNQQLDTVWLAE
ncbi:MAG: ABC transporter substrate-binding protein [Nitrospinae bacterium]|nr:ABC transporter substrate-binding protein [Nitrospinota bacterium]